MSSGPSVPRSQRKRRCLELTLSDEARAALDAIARAEDLARSRIVEQIVLRARDARRRP